MYVEGGAHFWKTDEIPTIKYESDLNSLLLCRNSMNDG